MRRGKYTYHRKPVESVEEIRVAVRTIAPQFPIERVVLFGSFARGEANAESDVDLLIDLSEDSSGFGMFAMGNLCNQLEDSLLREVDVLDAPYLARTNPRLNAAIERDKVVLYER